MAFERSRSRSRSRERYPTILQRVLCGSRRRPEEPAGDAFRTTPGRSNLAPPQPCSPNPSQQSPSLGRAISVSSSTSASSAASDDGVRTVREAIETAANSGEEFGECPCCFENMIGDVATHAPSVMLGRDGSRAKQDSGGRCEHIICHSCLRNLQTKTCPICRANFDTARELPSMWDEPQEWFKVVDADNSGTLSRGEVAKALMVMIPVNQALLERHITANWLRWDKDSSGAVDRQEFMQVARDVKKVLYKKTRSGRFEGHRTTEHALPHSAAERPMPNILNQPRDWFGYWDVDGSGSLEREECVRAIMLTLDLAGKLHDRRQCVRAIRSVFLALDSDASHGLDYEEFKSSGLWEGVCGILQEAQS